MIEMMLGQNQDLPATSADVFATLPPNSEHHILPPLALNQRLIVNLVGANVDEQRTRVWFDGFIDPEHNGVDLGGNGDFAEFVAVRNGEGFVFRLVGPPTAVVVEV